MIVTFIFGTAIKFINTAFSELTLENGASFYLLNVYNVKTDNFDKVEESINEIRLDRLLINQFSLTF